MEPTEFNCPWCHEWVPIDQFVRHINFHSSGGMLLFNGNKVITPETYEEFKRRFGPIGLLEER